MFAGEAAAALRPPTLRPPTLRTTILITARGASALVAAAREGLRGGEA
ncbi:MAG: hypothetical protein ACXU82_11855 [Caulobacteraceae bacterium]